MPGVKFNAHKRFHIIKSRTRLWDSSRELIQHFRFLFILSGEGKFILESQLFPYAPSGIILLKAGHKLTFQEDSDTEILVIAFDTFLAEDFQKKKSLSPDFADIYKQAEHLCDQPLIEQGRPIPNQRDGATITYLTNLLLLEVEQQPAHHYKMARNCIEMIVNILARNNIRYIKKEEHSQEDRLTESLLKYLTSELAQNKTIKVSDLLLKFNVSEDVINICLLNRTGMPLKKFILRYKTDLFKSRMLKMDILALAPYL